MPCVSPKTLDDWVPRGLTPKGIEIGSPATLDVKMQQIRLGRPAAKQPGFRKGLGDVSSEWVWAPA
ncbi:hypothetical protein A9Z06_17485 [Rhizobium sp. YK2]|nr:hypothetical protein A9Z06_17485 [Rhizobium sp. YK2]